VSRDTVQCLDLVNIVMTNEPSDSIKAGAEFLDRIVKKGLRSMEFVFFSLLFLDTIEFCVVCT
jgi:hypothetical protein